MTTNATPLRALLTELIDYAGLFPPAGLDMAAAVRNYASYLSGRYSWIVGRFVVPAGRLDEFAKAAAPYTGGNDWKVSVLGAPTAPLPGRGYAVDAVEVRADRVKDIHVPGPAMTYFEISPAAPRLEALIEAIAKVGARAKIRTGGLTADSFPEAARVAHFQWLCQKAGVAFKATAGLHHPVRGPHPFTYELGSARGLMHGFVNVFLAAAMIFAGASEPDATRLLEECSPDAFHFDNESVNWQSYRITREQIQSARERFAISFGSCSFEEPVRELAALASI
jgi:hypothetical protein